MAQVGVLSLSQLALHDHYDWNSGGPIDVYGRVSSATVKITNAAVIANNNAAPFECYKRILVLQDSPGTMRIDYDLECTVVLAGNVAHGQSRIYRGAALLWSGVDNPEVAGPVAYQDAAIAIDLQAGDTIEVWGYVIDAGGGGPNCSISQMLVRYTGSVNCMSRRVLTTALPVTGGDMLYQNIF